ncbi:unnamed protein product [Trichobilharzia regenti]|nr:unnamed protein product [Trichobilharzia regenti]
MLASRRVRTFKSLQIHCSILTLFLVVCETQGEIHPSGRRNSEGDIDYSPVNRMMKNAPLHNSGHINKNIINNNNNEIRTVEKRSAEFKPPERPAEFKTMEELNRYLKKLRHYYFIVGRPR